MPNHFLSHFRAPCRSFPADTTEQPSMRNVGCPQPIVDRLFHPRGHRYRPNMPCFAYQIDYGPMVLGTLKIITRPLRSFPPPQTATQEHRKNRTISLAI